MSYSCGLGKICDGTRNCALVQGRAAARRGLESRRPDAAVPAAPVGAHARARARNHAHRREPLYIRLAVPRGRDRQPMLPWLDEHAAPTAWWSEMQPPGARPHSKCTRFMPDQRASPVDSH